MHSATGPHFTIDLTVCDPNRFLDYTWNIRGDICWSDRFPILLEDIR